MAKVLFDHITKQFSDGQPAVNDLNLDIPDKEFLVLVGPSGSGKSTALRLLAGLEEITSGTILIGDRVVNGVPPKDRDIAMVFQSYALYPHMTVYDNMAFGLSLRGMAKDEIRRRVEEAGEILGIKELLHRKPRALSGGQRQRVALGRAIVRDPAVFLFDEPLSNLDAKLRVQTRAEISKLHQRLGTTFIYVTHDQVEAMTMATRIAVLNFGVLQQLGSPQDLYEAPRNIFVAGFIGSPAMNFFDVTLTGTPPELYLDAGHFKMPVPEDRKHVATPFTGKRLLLGIRPEHIHDAGYQPPGIRVSTVEATVDVTEMMGSEVIAYLLVGEKTFLGRLDPRTPARPGAKITVGFEVDRIHVFDPETELAVRPGMEAEHEAARAGQQAAAG